MSKFKLENFGRTSFNGDLYIDSFGDQYFCRDIYGFKYE